MPKIFNLSVLRLITWLRYPVRSAYREAWSAVDVRNKSERSSSSAWERKSESSKPTTLRCKRKCLLRLSVRWRKSWQALDSPTGPASATILRATLLISLRCLSTNNSDRGMSSSKLTSRLVLLLIVFWQIRYHPRILLWSVEIRPTWCTSSYRHPRRCSCWPWPKCNPKFWTSSTVNWRFSSTQTRTDIRRQRMRSRSSKLPWSLPRPPCARPTQAHSEWSVTQPQGRAPVKQARLHLQSLNGTRREIFKS